MEPKREREPCFSLSSENTDISDGVREMDCAGFEKPDDSKIIHAEISGISEERTSKKKGVRGARLSLDWTLSAHWRDWAVRFGLSPSTVDEEAEVFRDHWIAKSGSDACKVDWFATWRNWVRRSNKQGASNGSNRQISTSRAKRHSDALDEIARASIERERAERTLDSGDFQTDAGPLREPVG